MKKVILNVSEEIKHILPDTLEKDLQDDEIICPTCHGLGVVKRHQPFGFKEKRDDRFTNINWYDNEYLTFCPTCYGGVVSLCKHCGKPIAKGYIEKCDCEQYKKIEEQKELEKYQETIKKAREVDEKDIQNTYLYDNETDRYFDSVDDYLDYCECEEITPSEILWVCGKEEISIDADRVIESACEDLHEDASENCDCISLQKALDKWCKEQTGTTSFYPCYQEYVRVNNQ